MRSPRVITLANELNVIGSEKMDKKSVVELSSMNAPDLSNWFGDKLVGNDTWKNEIEFWDKDYKEVKKATLSDWLVKDETGGIEIETNK